jgi:glycosyltransferase involved in cell wall biosynthesis
MRISFYTPFKPLGHHHPSGDLVIATGLYDYLVSRGHDIREAGPLRARWLYWKPWTWIRLLKVYRHSCRQVSRGRVNLWLTYHTYYKAPDLLGPMVSRAADIPYVIFQGIFSTKRRRHPMTWPGFVLNRTALKAARHIFTNRRDDWKNLKRLLPEDRLTYVKPGILTEAFVFDHDARRQLRRAWGVGSEPVIFSAAMFRPDVKTEGLSFLIRSCGRLAGSGVSFQLVIAGDGKERQKLQQLADRHLPGRVRFVGKIKREQMGRYYSAGDLFVFPGIRESLGMVYLESQSCGLPVVAFHNGGIPEVVVDGETGFLTPVYQSEPFDDAIQKLVLNKELRRVMGQKAAAHVRAHHHLIRNYRDMETVLLTIVGEKEHAG